MEEENVFKLNMKKIRTMKKDLLSPLDDSEENNITIPTSKEEEITPPKPEEELVIPTPEPEPIPEPEPMPEPDLKLESDEIISEDVPSFKQAIEEKEETIEEKLRKISYLTFDLEEELKKIFIEKKPLQDRKDAVLKEIERIKKKLDVIAQTKKEIEESKKKVEEKEQDATPEQKREIEQERWKIEEQRNMIEDEKNEKEDEIRSLKLQLKECDFALEKYVAKENQLNIQLEVLRKDHEKTILGQKQKELLTELEKLGRKGFEIKEKMVENTRQKDEADKKLSDILIKERNTEEEIKTLEKRDALVVGNAEEVRKIEEERRKIEEKRKELEKSRWDLEDNLEKINKQRQEIKEEYQKITSNGQKIKDELNEINKKLEKILQ
ncbi:MAG: hypothetical protein MCSN_5480 [Candidatus Microsyncoccus archaeolyticus]|nr:MAG: hypothetical protein MCSN_5480 [Candidatus Parcubacteria bacterium]